MSFEQESAALQQRIAEIKNRYEPQLKALSDKGQTMSDDYEKPSDVGAVIGVDFKVDWKDVEIIFDVPSITVEDRSFSIDLPEVGSSQQKISFDVPDTRMVDRKVGQYPEIHGFTIEWKDIIVSVPEPYMRRVEIVTNIPSVTMKRQDFVIGIPKITTEQVRWVVGLPQFTVVNVSVQTQEIQDKGKGLQAEGEDLSKRMKSEIDVEVAKFKGALIGAAFSSKTDVSNGYNKALGTIKSTIEELAANGCDPIKVPTANGDVNLRKTYEDVDTNKARALSEFDQVAGVVS